MYGFGAKVVFGQSDNQSQYFCSGDIPDEPAEAEREISLSLSLPPSLARSLGIYRVFMYTHIYIYMYVYVYVYVYTTQLQVCRRSGHLGTVGSKAVRIPLI